jgi:membrane-bound lytic murein transglycosylase B
MVNRISVSVAVFGQLARGRLGLWLVLLLVGTICFPARAPSATFESRLQSFRERALKKGIPSSLIDRTLAGVRPDTTVLSNLRNQPEFQMTYSRYREIFLTENRIEDGVALAEKHRDLLAKLEDRYGIPSHVLLAIWGAESMYGQHSMKHDVIRAISTLAFADSGRTDYFQGELMALLIILDRGLIRRKTLRGSWAGAMGDPQFMPSSYLHYAVDFDGDGYRNIWADPEDVLASIGNYLEKNGWKRGLTWGWPAGTKPEAGVETRTVTMKERRYRVTSNFDALMRYNPSTNYALAIGELARAIRMESLKD